MILLEHKATKHLVPRHYIRARWKSISRVKNTLLHQVHQKVHHCDADLCRLMPAYAELGVLKMLAMLTYADLCWLMPSKSRCSPQWDPNSHFLKKWCTEKRGFSTLEKLQFWMNNTTLENAEFSRVLLYMKGFEKVHHLTGAVCLKTATSFILWFLPKFAKVHQTYTIFAEIAEKVQKSHILQHRDGLLSALL